MEKVSPQPRCSLPSGSVLSPTSHSQLHGAWLGQRDIWAFASLLQYITPAGWLRVWGLGDLVNLNQSEHGSVDVPPGAPSIPVWLGYLILRQTAESPMLEEQDQDIKAIFLFESSEALASSDFFAQPWAAYGPCLSWAWVNLLLC